MKNGQEILRLPVFAILEGKEVGRVKEAIVDPKEKKIKGLLIETNAWYEGLKMLPFKSLKSVAEMVMIESQAEIIPLVEVRESPSLKKGLKILDKKVLTDGGKFKGKVTNFLMEPRTGKITELEVELTEDSHQRERLPWNHLISLGEEALVVTEEPKNQSGVGSRESGVEEIIEKPEEVSEPVQEREKAAEAPKPTAQEVEKAKTVEEAPKKVEAEKAEEKIPEPVAQEEVEEKAIEVAAPPLAGPKEVEPPPNVGAGVSARPKEEKGGLKKFLEERQDKYLLGKRVGKDLVAPDGTTIAKAGEEISEAVIKKAKETKRYLSLSFFAQEK